MINAANYKLIGIDLTKLDIFDACIRASGVSYELPTLFLSECVITYISTKKSVCVCVSRAGVIAVVVAGRPIC